MTAQLNGSWYDPEAPGQGLNLEVLEDRGEALAYWYSYDSEGRQVWLVGQGPIDAAGVARLDFLITRGGRPGLPQEPVREAWGTGELSFDSCTRGRLLFASDLAGLEGEIPLARLTGGERCAEVKTLLGGR